MSDVPFLPQAPSSRYIVPEFRERTANGERVHNPYTKLFEERIIFLGVQIDDASADDVMAQLLTLESMDPDRDIQIYINSPGGSYTAMTAIYDTMQFVKPQVQTVCLGQAASAASVLLAAGTPGKRFALPHARVLIHQPYTEGGGQGSDIEIQANEILRMRKEMEVILARHTGRTEEQIEQDIERDKILTADMAKEHGIIDQAISSRKIRRHSRPAVETSVRARRADIWAGPKKSGYGLLVPCQRWWGRWLVGRSSPARVVRQEGARRGSHR